MIACPSALKAKFTIQKDRKSHKDGVTLRNPKRRGFAIRVAAHTRAGAINRDRYDARRDATSLGCRLFNTGGMREFFIAPRRKGAAENRPFSGSRGRPFSNLSAAHFQCGSPPIRPMRFRLRGLFVL